MLFVFLNTLCYSNASYNKKIHKWDILKCSINENVLQFNSCLFVVIYMNILHKCEVSQIWIEIWENRKGDHLQRLHYTGFCWGEHNENIDPPKSKFQHQNQLW